MKEFKTIEEQKEHLVETKNIKDDIIITKVLKERTYVSLINSYKLFFADTKTGNTHEYTDVTSINDYIALAALDDKISNKLHYLIGLFEKRLKNTLSYEYSKYLKKEGDLTCTSYIDHMVNLQKAPFKEINCDKLGFKTLTKKYTQKTKLIEASGNNFVYRLNFLDEIISVGNGNRRAKTKIVTHYQDKNKPVPFWLLVHEFTMGQIIEFIELLNDDLREKIYYNFHGFSKKYDVNRFFNNAHHIKDLRNVISHNEPILPHISNKDSKNINKSIDILVSNYKETIIVESNDVDLDSIKVNDLNKDIVKATKIVKEIL